MNDSAVRLFSLSTCSHCKATKKLLEENRVRYAFTDVDLLEKEARQAALEDLQRFNPDGTFPTLIIGKRVIVGFREDAIREALGL